MILKTCCQQGPPVNHQAFLSVELCGIPLCAIMHIALQSCFEIIFRENILTYLLDIEIDRIENDTFRQEILPSYTVNQHLKASSQSGLKRLPGSL